MHQNRTWFYIVVYILKMNRNLVRFSIVFFMAILSLLPIQGQNFDFKQYSNLSIENSDAYKNGNVYQKDLLLIFTDNTNVSLHPISMNQVNLALQQPNNQINSVRENMKQPFLYKLLPEQSICYLQFNTCTDQSAMRFQYYMNNSNNISEDLEKTLSQYPRFDTFLKEMFQTIETNKIKTLVIDVRSNSGGNSKLCEDSFLSKLLEGKKEVSVFEKIDEYFIKNEDSDKIFKGNIIFIQNAKTYSSAGLLITVAVDNNIGIVVGSKSSYRPCSYGDLLAWKLPNTKTRGFVSHKIFNRPQIRINAMNYL